MATELTQRPTHVDASGDPGSDRRFTMDVTEVSLDRTLELGREATDDYDSVFVERRAGKTFLVAAP